MFDVLTIAAVADELTATLLDGRVQRIGLIDPLTLAAEVYAGGRRRMLVASADARHARLHLTDRSPSLDPALVTPFVLLLRKYVRGGIVIGIDQPPLERLVRVSIAKRPRPHNERRSGREAAEPEPEDDGAEWDDDGEIELIYVHLVVELMGRHSNLILVDDEGLIMESVKRVTPAMSRVRPILPRQPYTLPPPLDKPDPRRLTAVEAERLLGQEPDDAALASVLVRRLRGVSPQMGREIAHRVGGDAAAVVGAVGRDGAATLARETRGLLEPLLTSAWSPRVYREQGDVVAFAAVPMAHLAAVHAEEAVPTISAAAELAETPPDPLSPTAHAQRRERLAQAIREARERLENRVASLEAEAAKASEAERLREHGELIYAYLWQIAPGQTELTVDGTRIPLDPSRSAKENAQAYFERYRKAQSGAAHLPELLAQAERERAYLDQLLTLTAQAEGFAEIEALTAEWEAHRGPTAPAKGKAKASAADRRPRPLLDRHGNAVYVGHSGRQNDAVTFDVAGPDDTWLHARGVPGSHVIVRWRPGAEEDPATVEAAAALAAHYSAGRGSAHVEVDATKRRHVRKIKGAGPGMVTYRQERTVAVRPADEAALKDVLRAE